MLNLKLSVCALAAPLLLPALAVSTALAADDTSASTTDSLEQVVITAEKRPDTVQNTAASVEVVSGQTVQEQGMNNVGDVLKDIPGVVIRNSAGGATIEVRGISSGAVPNNDAASPIGVSTDGVYNNLAGAAGGLSFFDINRVEVLRGPQGTLYGAGAEGGVINILSNDPELGKYDAAANLEAGNYDLEHAGGMLNLPWSDWLALRVAGNSINRKGYYTSGGDDQVTSSGRAKLLFKPIDTFSLLLGVEYTKLGGFGNLGGGGAGANAWGLVPPLQPYNDLASGAVFPGRSSPGENLKEWANVNWDLGFGVLNLLPSHINNVLYTHNFACPGPPGSTCAVPNATLNVNQPRQDSAEVSLSNEASSTWIWKVGAFYSDQRVYGYSNQGNPGFNLLWPRSKAVYAQTTVPVTTATRIVAGVRENQDSKSFYTSSSNNGLNTPGSGEGQWHHFDWKLGVEQDLTPSSMVYATLATGYRPGSVSAGSSSVVLGPAGTPVPNSSLYTQPEDLLSVELGSKNMFFDNTLRVNGDVYYYNYKNRQYTAFFFLTGPGLCPNGQEATAQSGYNCNVEENASKSTSYGAELQVQWLFTKDDEVDASAAFLSSKVTATQFTAVGPPPGPYFTSTGAPGPGNGINNVDINGDTLPNSPRWQIDADYQHIFELGAYGKLVPRVDVRYTALSYISGFNYVNLSEYQANGQPIGWLFFQPAYTEYDLSLTYSSNDGKWSLAGYGKNLGDLAIKTDTDGQFTQAAAPRTYGVTASWHL